MAILACGGCLKDLFVTEEEIIDRFTGQELWLWGTGTNGRLGDNTVSSKSSPVQTISGGTSWKCVTFNHSFDPGATGAGIKTDGTLWMWGCNCCAMLGLNTGTTAPIGASSPVQTVSGGTNWRTVAIGNDHVAAIKTDGTLWLWGSAANGRLGNNDTITAIQSSPVQTISGGTNWKSVSLGNDFSGAIKSDGTLWMWGEASSGRLGNNSTIDRSSPVQTISGGVNWRSISIGATHSVATKTDNTLWVWGRNFAGGLGIDGSSAVNRSSPVQTLISGGVWRSGAAGGYFSAGIKTDGTLWLWGGSSFDALDNSGVLGNDSIQNTSSPVQTVSGGTNWRCVSIAIDSSAAIKTDGTLWLWGWGGNGRLGDETAVAKSSPVQTITGGTNWRSVAAGSGPVGSLRLTEY